MAKKVLVDVTTFVDQHDMTTDVNQVAIPTEVDAPECTTFGSGGWRQRAAGGLASGEFTLNGYWNDQTVDTHALAALATQRTVTTVTPNGTDGDTSYSFQSVETQYQPFGEIGSVAPFTLQQMTSGAVRRGGLLFPKQTVSAVTNGTITQLGAVASGKKLAVAINCFTAGTTANVVVQSDDLVGFASPTQRANETFTAVGGRWVTVDGPITDTFWRVIINTITGSFSFAVAVSVS